MIVKLNVYKFKKSGIMKRLVKDDIKKAPTSVELSA